MPTRRKSKTRSASLRGNKNSKTHGHACNGVVSRTYRSWRTMKDRCINPSVNGFERYGGRGIGVCDRWHKFENFLEDMGERPDGTSLDRIDADADYCPSNCRWSTAREQANNRRNNVFVEFAGKVQTIARWSEDLGIPKSTLWNRRLAGCSDDEIITGRRRATK